MRTGLQLNPTQIVSNFHNGQYLVYVLSGHVQMRVSNLSPSANVVLSGLFFGTSGSRHHLYVYGAERRGVEHSFRQLYRDAEWQLQWFDYCHSLGRRPVHTNCADLQQLCRSADVHHHTDSSGASDADSE